MQRQIRALVADMQGRASTCSIFHSSSDDRLDSDASLDDLVNEGSLDMNDIIPEDSGDNSIPTYNTLKPYEEKRPRTDETGFHPIKSRQTRMLNNYEARRQERQNEYHKKIIKDQAAYTLCISLTRDLVLFPSQHLSASNFSLQHISRQHGCSSGFSS